MSGLLIPELSKMAEHLQKHILLLNQTKNASKNFFHN